MNQQTPAQGIMEMSRYPDSRCFRVSCDCGATEHQVDAWIEVDRDVPFVTVTFYAELWTPVSDFWQRVKIAWHVLVHGVHRQEHDLMLRGQAARNLAGAINKAVDELESQ
jgi:hypothetical protein|nr:hypothetical protein [Oxalobacteraceae bacterium]